METQRIYSFMAGSAALLMALVVPSSQATAQNFNSPAVAQVENLANGAKRVVIKQGANWRVSVGSNQTVENLLIDISRPGANANISASGSGWTIRNIGFKGKIGVDGRSQPEHALTLSGQDGTVENVYLGDGSADMTRAIGVFINHRNTPGPINFHRVHVSKFANNGIYGSPTAEELRGGVINIYDSYFNSNNIANFKLGSPNAPCLVKDTVVRSDQTPPRISWNGSSGKINKRAMWALDNPGGGHPNRHRVILDNVDIQGAIVSEPGGIVELKNTRFSGRFVAGGDIHENGDPAGKLVGSSAGQPDLSPPAGVPMSALEAATAGAQSDSPDADPNDPPDSEEPPETEPILELLHRSQPVAVDGVLDEADWQNAAIYSFSDSSGGSDNTAEVRALWDETSLYFGWKIDDPQLETDPGVPAYKEDAVELFLDPLLDRGADQQPDDPHVIVTLAGRANVTNHAYEDISQELGFESAVSRDEGGYVVEFSLDWSGLEVSPEEGLQMGALFANIDRDDGQASTFTESVSTPYRRPDVWPTVVLGTANSPDTETGTPDAGSNTREQADATTSPDTFGSGDAGIPDTGTEMTSIRGTSGCSAGQASAPGPHAAVAWLLVLLGAGAMARRRRMAAVE